MHSAGATRTSRPSRLRQPFRSIIPRFPWTNEGKPYVLTRRVRNRWIACSKAEDREILCTDIKPAEDALPGLVKKR